MPRKPAVDEAEVIAFRDALACSGSLDPNVHVRVTVGCTTDLAFRT
jgi:hypothetical protein